MEQDLIWLIDHKAMLGEFSPLNIDGSEWIQGVCVLGAESQEEAEAKFSNYLYDNQMDLIDVYEFLPYKSEDYMDDSDLTKQINHAVGRVRSDGVECYIYARTSETVKSDEEDAVSEAAADAAAQRQEKPS